jgi:hypothetical protein
LIVGIGTPVRLLNSAMRTVISRIAVASWNYG